MSPSRSFQGLILALERFWAEWGCVLLQPYDMEVGAGTFHPATTLRALGPKPWNAAYVQPSRRPKDGRYGENPNRLQHYYQFQVILKPSPSDMQELYLKSLFAIGIDPAIHDIRFVEDDWESPTLGAWGLGWECWCDGMEVSQFTYFQQVAGFECRPVSGELTYGLERLAMYVQGVENVFDLNFNGREDERKVTYGDIFLQAEQEYSRHNFESADVEMLFEQFRMAEAACRKYLDDGWVMEGNVRRQRMVRRRLGELIRQGVDQLVRMRLLHRFRDLIDKPDVDARLAPAEFLDHRLTVVALAPVAGVVLRDRRDRRLGVLLKISVHLIDRELQHVRIRQAALHVTIRPLALDEREIFRMRVEQFRRHEMIKCVDELRVDHLAAGRLIEMLVLPVDLQMGGPIFVERLGEVRLAIFERRTAVNV